MGNYISCYSRLITGNIHLKINIPPWINKLLNLYYWKIITIALQGKLTPTQFSLCINVNQELILFCFCESLLSWCRMFADSAITVITIPTFDNGFETIEDIWSFTSFCAQHCVKSVQIRSFSWVLVRIFPVFRLNTGKYGPEKTPYFDTFHAVQCFLTP